MSALRLINETTATSATTMSVTDVFTSDFDIYKITLYSESALEQETNLRFINSSGSIVTATNYDYAQLYMRAYSAFTPINSTNQNNIRLVVGTEDNFGGNAVLWVFNPTNTNSYTFLLHQGSLAIDLNNNNTVSYASNKGIGVLKQTASMTGFHLINNTVVSGDYTAKVYGLRVDNG